MDPNTLKALQESIAKWQRNSQAQKPENYLASISDCPLCDLFWSSDCNGCPVRAMSDQPYCRDTPYEAAYEALDLWERNSNSAYYAHVAHSAARDEVAFLQSLLPENDQ